MYLSFFLSLNDNAFRAVKVQKKSSPLLAVTPRLRRGVYTNAVGSSRRAPLGVTIVNRKSNVVNYGNQPNGNAQITLLQRCMCCAAKRRRQANVGGRFVAASVGCMRVLYVNIGRGKPIRKGGGHKSLTINPTF